MDELICLCLNVRGLADENKRKQMFNWLKKKNPDVVCLQETHSTQKEEKTWTMQWNGEITFNHGSHQSGGTCVMFRDKNDFDFQVIHCNVTGRCNIVKIHKEGKQFLLVNIYAPNEDNPEFFKEVINIVENEVHDELIVCGDFNLVMDPTIDRTENIRHKPRAFEMLNKYIEERELIELWRAQNTDTRYYSWSRQKNYKRIASRIDFALFTGGIANVVSRIEYLPSFKTDHSLLSFTISQTKQKRGPGYWKFNNRLLKDKEFVEKSNKIIERVNVKYRYAQNHVDKWELCLNELSKMHNILQK